MIGETLRHLRHERGLSQGQICARTGLERTHLSRLENGHSEPTLRVLYDVCWHGFGMQLSEFFAVHEAPARRCRKEGRLMPELRDPATPQEWQQAVDGAHACLALESARLFGLVKGGPGVNTERCEEILTRGAALGIKPSRDAIERFARELVG